MRQGLVILSSDLEGLPGQPRLAEDGETVLPGHPAVAVRVQPLPASHVALVVAGAHRGPAAACKRPKTRMPFFSAAIILPNV
eukprot:scaffold304105_cov40-Prasinocladus_malaysianus.AAC.1